MVITFGHAATDRSSSVPAGWTYVATVPVGMVGTIDTISFNAATNMTGVFLATFGIAGLGQYVRVGTWQLDVGSVSAGLNTITGLSIPTLPQSMPGIYFATGSLEADDSGDDIQDNDGADLTGESGIGYYHHNGKTISLYGSGTAPDESTLPAVITSEATLIGTTTAVGNATIADDGGETITERGICWNLTGNPTRADHKESDNVNAEGAIAKSLTGLPPSVPVFCKGYAVNIIGTGYGNQVTFRTFAPAFMF